MSCIACGAPLRRHWLVPTLVAAAVVAGFALLFATTPGLRETLNRIPLVQEGTADRPSVEATDTGLPAVGPELSPQVATTTAPTDTPTPAPTDTEAPTWTPTPTRTQPPTRTPTPRPTWTPVLTPTATTTPTLPATATATPTLSPTATATASPTLSPTATATSTPSPSATPRIYTVRAGDTLYDIAIRFETTVNAIIQANGLTSTNLSVGQRLIIPAATPTPTPAAGARHVPPAPPGSASGPPSG